jgi:hypothetical protein
MPAHEIADFKRCGRCLRRFGSFDRLVFLDELAASSVRGLGRRARMLLGYKLVGR